MYILTCEFFVRPTDKRKIYLQPIGIFNKPELLAALQEFVQAYYYGVAVQVLLPIGIQVENVKSKRTISLQFPNNTKQTIRSRVCHRYDKHKLPESHRQLYADSILAFTAPLIPNDGYCMCNITMEDLYAGPDDSFVVRIFCSNVLVWFGSWRFQNWHFFLCSL